MIFSANDSVFRAEHDPLLRTAYFLSKTRVLRVRKERSTLKIVPRYMKVYGYSRHRVVARKATSSDGQHKPPRGPEMDKTLVAVNYSQKYMF